ncbi:MAG: polyphosphate kinase 1 [candidate division NC10 bacterium]
MSDRMSYQVDLESPEAFFNRELSWLNFVGRVIALAEDPSLPLMERVKFAGITGMLHDEFFMKRMSGIKREIRKMSHRPSSEGLRFQEEFEACRKEILEQMRRIGRAIEGEFRPQMAKEGLPILNYSELNPRQQESLREYFRQSILPILTPLAVDSEHPFPFISSLGLNLAVVLPDDHGGRDRFIRIKVPDNRPRWVPLPGDAGFTPLEQVITANFDLMYPSTPPLAVYSFRVTRGAEGEPDRTAELAEDESLEKPGGIIDQVSRELKARRFAGVVRLELDPSMPRKFQEWLARQLRIGAEDLYPTGHFLGLCDLMQLKVTDREELHFPPHDPVTHPRLRRIRVENPHAIFEEIARGDILLHHPYHNFDTSVLRFLESAAADPAVLAIKLTIYRTSSDSPIVKALAEAARRGKQVVVLVEVTARFDEAPNIAWAQHLENEGVHVAYGVERLKTHVKLGLVVRDEDDRIRRYAHIGTGNYHTLTARIYEDLGVLTCDPEMCEDVATVFNALTGTTPYGNLRKMVVAPVTMRKRFTELIRREAEHARAGRPCGIDAKMNQLQDPEVIRELYLASQAGVPIRLNVRGKCVLRPGVPGLSQNIHVFSVVGRFLEHSRITRFLNGGDPEYFIASADWMRRNLSNRVEIAVPISDETLRHHLDGILEVYDNDNCSAWDCGPDGVYVRRTPREGETWRAAQDTFIQLAQESRKRKVILANLPWARAQSIKSSRSPS